MLPVVERAPVLQPSQHLDLRPDTSVALHGAVLREQVNQDEYLWARGPVFAGRLSFLLDWSCTLSVYDWPAARQVG